VASAKNVEWGVAVRRADGSHLFYAPHRGRQSQEDWSPRKSQARRYATREEAERDAQTFGTNAQAREYLAIQLS
jgi:hypothetical protein